MQALRENVWLRVLLLVIALIVIAPLSLWSFGNNADKALVIQSLWSLSFKAATVIGYCLPAIVLGAACGWIKYSKSAWLWATVVLLSLTLVLVTSTYLHPV